MIDLGRCSNQRSTTIHFCSVGMLCSQVGGQLPEARALPPSHPAQDTCSRCPENGWAGWCTSPWSYRGRAALNLGPQGACGRGPGCRSPPLSPRPALPFLAAGSLSDRFSPLIWSHCRVWGRNRFHCLKKQAKKTTLKPWFGGNLTGGWSCRECVAGGPGVTAGPLVQKPASHLPALGDSPRCLPGVASLWGRSQHAGIYVKREAPTLTL